MHKITKEKDGLKKFKKAIDKLLKKGEKEEEASYMNMALAEEEAQTLSKKLMRI